ncbi:tripartite tricarboxylate transporter substrate binding protein [Bacillus sp. Marseille-P3661]|uniref:tripartite tricarboxylate transporter substrate binding protein n=1 Tax=Bacillus sp. Marseille-P3661 TaxID=1936234 RepID=UPI000C82B177|nr:tripartite tricarboxylate transporter substrate binding protein [Bacillus sp. Marseille-P3661]
MKKLVSVFISVLVILSLVACSGGNASSNESTDKDVYPNKSINLIVSFAAGGGMDTGARILAPYLEKELGVTVNVVNKPGAGGWVGWAEVANAEPDGYTIGYLGTPNFVTGYLDPKVKRDQSIDSFDLIGKHVQDPGVIAIRTAEDRFSTIEELMEYAKENELTATSTGVGSDDHIATLSINKKFGTKFTPVHNEGSAKSVSAALGGHVDVLFGNVGEVTSLQENGEMKVLAVLAEERSPFLPDVPTFSEAGFEGVTSAPSRGFATPKGMDPEKLETLRVAFEKAITNQEHIDSQADSGLQVEYKPADEYKQELKNIEAGLKEISDMLGW